LWPTELVRQLSGFQADSPTGVRKLVQPNSTCQRLSYQPRRKLAKSFWRWFTQVQGLWEGGRFAGKSEASFFISGIVLSGLL